MIKDDMNIPDSHFECEQCWAIVRKSGKSNHHKTKKHTRAVESLEADREQRRVELEMSDEESLIEMELEQGRIDSELEKCRRSVAYYQSNKERWKEAYKKNKVEISKKAKIKVQCECGSMIRKDHWAHHRRSKKHKQILALK